MAPLGECQWPGLQLEVPREGQEGALESRPPPACGQARRVTASRGRQPSARAGLPGGAPSGIQTPTRLGLFRDIYGPRLWDISGIGQGYDQVLDIPGVSFEVFEISLGHSKTRKDIPKSENLEWDIPKLINDKCSISFFVLGYLSLSHPILVPIRFSAMQLVARKPAWLSPMNATLPFMILVPPAQALHRAHVTLLVHSSSLALPTPRRFRRSGWGRPGRGQVRGLDAPAPHLHSGEGSWGSAMGITSTPSALASASSLLLSGGGGGKGGDGRGSTHLRNLSSRIYTAPLAPYISSVQDVLVVLRR
jgi:hypothetical protein